MLKRLLALTICAVLLSTVITTTAVSAAKQAGHSDGQQYDIKAEYRPDIVGKFAVNFQNGHYVIEANWGKTTTTPDGADYKDFIKGFAPHAGQIIAANGAQSIKFGLIVYNKGGTAHGEGTLDKATVDWLKAHGDGAIFYTHRV